MLQLKTKQMNLTELLHNDQKFLFTSSPEFDKYKFALVERLFGINDSLQGVTIHKSEGFCYVMNGQDILASLLSWMAIIMQELNARKIYNEFRGLSDDDNVALLYHVYCYCMRCIDSNGLSIPKFQCNSHNHFIQYLYAYTNHTSTSKILSDKRVFGRCIDVKKSELSGLSDSSIVKLANQLLNINLEIEFIEFDTN